MWNAVYELTTGRFLRGGMIAIPYNPATEGLAKFPPDAPPDPITERYAAAGSPRPVRPATPAESTVATTAVQDADSDTAVGQACLTAHLEWMLRRVLGRTPTGPERQQARTEWRAIYRAIRSGGPLP